MTIYEYFLMDFLLLISFQLQEIRISFIFDQFDSFLIITNGKQDDYEDNILNNDFYLPPLHAKSLYFFTFGLILYCFCLKNA